MSRRISHSVMDPWISPSVRGLYTYLPVPRTFPPEGIVAIGHLLAILAGLGFAWSTEYWWAGLLVAFGVTGNHVADILDGTHARKTGQCRNGGELLDHFVDPLSFSYWLGGWAVSCGRLDLGLIAVICLYATAVLTNIKAKMIGQFTLASFGPTEFKALLVAYGFAQFLITGGLFGAIDSPAVAFWSFSALIAFGIVQLAVQLVRAVGEVNRLGGPPDTAEWESTREAPLHEASPAAKPPDKPTGRERIAN